MKRSTIYEMADSLKALAETIRAACHRLGLTPKKRIEKGIYDDYILSQVDPRTKLTFKTCTEMAIECGALPATIFNSCIRLGIRIKKKPHKTQKQEPQLPDSVAAKETALLLQQDPAIFNEIMDAVHMSGKEQPIHERPPTEYTQGSSYLKLLEKYAS